MIKVNFENEISNLGRYLSELKVLEEIDQGKLSFRIQNDVEEKIRDLKDLIENVQTNREYNFYLMKSTPILEVYLEILSRPIKINFATSKSVDVNKPQKDKIILEYLKIAKKYISISDIISPEISNEKCEVCGGVTFEETDTNNRICVGCGYQDDFFHMSHLNTDSKRINITSKYVYDRRNHFRDCLNQYQGKQNSIVDESVSLSLMKCFETHNLLIGNQDTPKIIRFSKITREHIRFFLKETGNTKHYEDDVMIHTILTDQKPPNLSEIEESLISDFDKLVELYDKKRKDPNWTNGKVFMATGTRKNFINSQYVLYQLLRKHRIVCSKDDFNILKTFDRKTAHDVICEELFKELDWNFTYDT